MHDYRGRQRRLGRWLTSQGCEAAVIVDFEGTRDRSLRYLCGHVGDALLFAFAPPAAGRSAPPCETLLVAWDVPLAERLAVVDAILPYEQFDRRLPRALREVLSVRGVSSAELTARLPFPLVRALEAALPGVTLSCREEGVNAFLAGERAVKQPEEIACLRRACRVTDELLLLVEERLKSGREASEVEVALLLEREARLRGAEGTSFATLAAGPGRSFGIHCFPAVTAGPFGAAGLSILDFGVSFAGYGSDVTTTVVHGPLRPAQRAMRAAVEDAYALAVSLCRPGAAITDITAAVDDLFASRGFAMPHGLGHGVGLDAHEEPYLRHPRRRAPAGEPAAGEPAAGEPADPSTQPPDARRLNPGMVITIEPGLYDPEEGGVRLENDLLITEESAEVLTSSRLIELA